MAAKVNIQTTAPVGVTVSISDGAGHTSGSVTASYVDPANPATVTLPDVSATVTAGSTTGNARVNVSVTAATGVTVSITDSANHTSAEVNAPYLDPANPGIFALPDTLVSILVPLIDTMTNAPSPAPAGTVHTITITAHDPNTPPQALASASLTRSDGGAVTPVSGQPAGTFKWNTTI